MADEAKWFRCLVICTLVLMRRLLVRSCDCCGGSLMDLYVVLCLSSFGILLGDVDDVARGRRVCRGCGV